MTVTWPATDNVFTLGTLSFLIIVCPGLYIMLNGVMYSSLISFCSHYMHEMDIMECGDVLESILHIETFLKGSLSKVSIYWYSLA